MKLDLSTGIFFPSDISLILGIKKRKINSWLNNYWANKLNYFNNSKAVNFLILIEVYVFNTFLEKGISRKKITLFHEKLNEKLNVMFPFAYKSFFYTKNEIFTTKKSNYFDTNFNYIIQDFIIPFADKIDFSKKKNYACRFYPQGRNSKIVVDPNIQFGRPTIKGTRITTDVIYEMLQENANIEDIAFWYDLDKNTVNEIAKFYNFK